MWTWRDSLCFRKASHVHARSAVAIGVMGLFAEGVRDVKGEMLHVFLVADETAAVIVAVNADIGPFLRPGDICELQQG